MSENRQKGTGMEKLFEICRLAQISAEVFRQNAVFVVGATCGRPRACEARPYGLFGGFDAKEGCGLPRPSGVAMTVVVWRQAVAE